MIKLPVYNQAGEKKKDLEVSSRIFGVKIKPEVIHQVVVAQMANSRQVLADTKGKGEVRGGGKKPWKQKGTGRARHGSIRSPLWKGGGVTFGPTSDRNFSLKVNKKQKQIAMAMCLSDKINSDGLIVFDGLQLSGKTKELNLWIADLKQKIASLKESKKFLMVSDGNDANIINAALNLKNINTISADSLNCIELLKYEKVLLTEKAMAKIEAHYKKINEKKA
ncbi:MAG: 50S ribosomal protein L4 [Candidatus Buchananbacteria bacterium]